MDPEIEELTRLVKQTLAVAQDTNHAVHSLRRAARWGRFFQIVWWVAVFAASSAAYYYYLQPYVTKLEEVYGQIQTGSQEAQNFGTQVQDFLKNLVPQQAPQAQQ